jgi:NTP pyrophosphatase (non-canonical NTP hydrolase)
MTFKQYQLKSRKTAIYKPIGYQVVYPALGIAGEAGELIEKIKKLLRNDQGVLSAESRHDIKIELGDLLWYMSQVATDLEIDMEDVAQSNLDKLFDRQKRGVLHSSGDWR